VAPWHKINVFAPDSSNRLHLSVFLLNVAILLYLLHIRIAAYRSLAYNEAEAQGQNQH
jgi:hypothetical protein